MARYPLTGSRIWLSATTRVRGRHWKGGNYRSLKLIEQVMKVMERIVDGLIRQLVSIDDSQFGFVLGNGTTDAIFVVRQLQEKYLAANKRLHMAFVDLEKAFDWVPRKVIWWVLRKLCVEECIVWLVKGMYANALSRVYVGEGYSEEFEVKVGVHQGSVLSPLLFIIVLEALSCKFRSGVPWEDLYADDLVIIAESLEECVRRLLTWKEAIEEKGLRVNAGNMKIVICGTGLNLLQSSGEFPCAVCRTGVGSNSIFCNDCMYWVHRKCSRLKRLTKYPEYRCTWWQGTACPLDGRPQREDQVRPDKLEVVASFCYLGDMLSAAGGCELSTTTCVKTAWKKFKELLPVLSCSHLSFKTCGSCVWSAMSMPVRLGLYKAKPPTSAEKWQGNNQRDLQCQAARHCHHQIQWGTCAAWHWGSGPHSEGEKAVGMDMWNTPMVQSTAFDLQVDGKRGPGRPKMTLKQLTERDCREWKLSAIDPHDRYTWCEICHKCSKPTTWKGAHWCGCCLCTCMLIKNPLMMMMTWNK